MSISFFYYKLLSAYDKLRGNTRLIDRILRLEERGWNSDEAKALTLNTFQFGMSLDALLDRLQKELNDSEPRFSAFKIIDAHPGQRFSENKGPYFDYVDNIGCDTYVLNWVHHRPGKFAPASKEKIAFHFLLKENSLETIVIIYRTSRTIISNRD